MFNVRPSYWIRMFIIVGYHYGDSGVELPYAVNKIFEFIIAQKGLGGYGDKGANIVLYRKMTENRSLGQ